MWRLNGLISGRMVMEPFNYERSVWINEGVKKPKWKFALFWLVTNARSCTQMHRSCACWLWHSFFYSFCPCVICRSDDDLTCSWFSAADNDCKPNPCQNGGRCINQLNGFLCLCAFGFRGQTCKQSSKLEFCARAFHVTYYMINRTVFLIAAT